MVFWEQLNWLFWHVGSNYWIEFHKSLVIPNLIIQVCKKKMHVSQLLTSFLISFYVTIDSVIFPPPLSWRFKKALLIWLSLIMVNSWCSQNTNIIDHEAWRLTQACVWKYSRKQLILTKWSLFVLPIVCGTKWSLFIYYGHWMPFVFRCK